MDESTRVSFVNAAELDRLFVEQRALLLGLAYRMLGSHEEAQDTVQDAFLRFRDKAVRPRNARAFLFTMVTRMCLDRLKAAQNRRRSYPGPWLPEPSVQELWQSSPEAAAERRDSVAFALVTALEVLSPTERAVFVLRELFDRDYPEIARVVRRSEVACRQAFHRARRRLACRAWSDPASHRVQQEVTLRFWQAVRAGDLTRLLELLLPDAVAVSDGGGLVPAARRPVSGALRVARFVLGLARKAPASGFELVALGGEPGFLALASDNEPLVAGVCDVCEGRVRGIYMIRNPEKLARMLRHTRWAPSGCACQRPSVSRAAE